jgi:MFS family permease
MLFLASNKGFDFTFTFAQTQICTMSFLRFFANSNATTVFKHKEFNLLVGARILITLAFLSQNVTLYWQMFELTGDALSLGIIGLTEAIPSLLVALYAGHLADTKDRKTIATVSYFVFWLCSLALFAVAYFLPVHFLKQNTYLIYIIVFISGLARGFYRPASFALLTQVLPRDLYANGVAWNSTFWQTASVGGSALGGLIIGLMGVSYSFLFSVILSFCGWLLITNISAKPPVLATVKQSLRESLFEGVKFVFKSQVFLGAMMLDLIAVLFGGAVALLSIFAKEILHVGAFEFGLLNAAPSLGAILTAIYLAYKPPLKRAGKILLISVAGFGLSMIGFALSTSFYLSLLMLLLSGVFDSFSVVIRSSIMQLLTPDNMRGRVSAVNTMFIGSSNELGAFESGLAARLLGLIPSVVAGGAIAVFSAVTAGFTAPKLRNLNLKEQH